MEWKWISIIQSSIFHRQVYSRLQTRNAVSLSFKIIGDSVADADAPPVLLLHGLLGSKRHWEGLGKTIMNMTKRSVVAVDLRNHGDSPHVGSHKYKELATDVLQLYEKLAIDKASLIGHSMGGRAAMCVALLAPEKVAGVLVVDISPVSTANQLLEFFPKVMDAMKVIDFSGVKHLGKARKAAKRHLKLMIADDVTMRAVLSNINVRADRSVGWTCNLDVLIRHFKYIASFPWSMKGRQYAGPTLFLGGQLSDFIPADDLPGIREYFPQAVIAYVPRAGHNLHADHPRAFLEHTIAFIRTN